jgi:hypothetical protein
MEAALMDPMTIVARKLEEHSHRFSAMEADIKELKTDVRRLGLLMEAQEGTTQQILEIVQLAAAEVQDRRAVLARLENHEHRISALESAYHEKR